MGPPVGRWMVLSGEKETHHERELLDERQRRVVSALRDARVLGDKANFLEDFKFQTHAFREAALRRAALWKAAPPVGELGCLKSYLEVEQEAWVSLEACLLLYAWPCSEGARKGSRYQCYVWDCTTRRAVLCETRREDVFDRFHQAITSGVAPQCWFRFSRVFLCWEEGVPEMFISTESTVEWLSSSCEAVQYRLRYWEEVGTDRELPVSRLLGSAIDAKWKCEVCAFKTFVPKSKCYHCGTDVFYTYDIPISTPNGHQELLD